MEAEIFQRAQQVAQANRQLTHANDALARLYREIELLMARADSELHSGAGAGESAGAAQQPIAPEDMLARVGQLILGHKRLEEQLRQSQKMEAVGRLAGGVAHDFNNLLTVITGYAALIRDGAESESAPEVEEIERAVMRAATLTHKLLAFSRKQVLQPRIIGLNAVVGGMEDMLRRLIGEDVLLVIIQGSGLGNIKADPNQIEQVIMNLAVNARDAMPKGGRVIIETRKVHVGLEALKSGAGAGLEGRTIIGATPGDYVLLSVSDTGHGMDAGTAARVFEPFFTTKEMGKGTGLGLSTVFGIVEQSGGLITLETAPGAGTTFRVYLPVDAGTVEQTVAPQASDATARRTGRVLVVEDEAPLRRLVTKVLTGAGYKVLDAANGDEALALAARNPSIDLLLTDVVMLGMRGPELVARLRASRPELVVLYMSGYDRDLIDQKTLENSASFLPKPFTPRALRARVSELIGAQHGGAEGGTQSAKR